MTRNQMDRMWREQLGDQATRRMAADWCDEHDYPEWLGRMLRDPDADTVAVRLASLRAGRPQYRLPARTKQLMRWCRDLLSALRA